MTIQTIINITIMTTVTMINDYCNYIRKNQPITIVTIITTFIITTLVIIVNIVMVSRKSLKWLTERV